MTGPQIPQGTTALAEYVKGLTGQVENLAGEASRLRTYGHRNRLFIVVDIILTVGLSFAGYLAVRATEAANSATAAQMALCQAGNVARAQQTGLWEYVIHLSPPPKTAQGRLIVARFEHHLRVTFRPRDCARLGQPGGPATSAPRPSPSAIPGGRR